MTAYFWTYQRKCDVLISESEGHSQNGHQFSDSAL